MTALRRFAQVLGLLALSVGCSQVLGIEDAHVDAELVAGGGSSTQGGSSVVAGSSEVAGGTHNHGSGGSAGGKRR